VNPPTQTSEPLDIATSLEPMLDPGILDAAMLDAGGILDAGILDAGTCPTEPTED